MVTGSTTGAVFELGHKDVVGATATANGHVVAIDISGHWTLWDTATKALLGNGDIAGPNWSTVAMAGNVFAIQGSSAVELRSASDGHLIVSTPSGQVQGFWAPFGLATDGSYLWVGSPTSLQAWSSTGTSLFSHAGTYADNKGSVHGFATPTEILIGRSTSQTIEHIAAPGGASTMGPAFAGAFQSWFLDGSSFFTAVGTNVRIYTPSAVQEVLVSLPSVQSLAGTGGYFWTDHGIYQVANPTAPPQSWPGGIGSTLSPSANLVAVTDGAYPNMVLFHLDPGGITSEMVTVPTVGVGALGADAAGNWSLGAGSGLVWDSTNLPAGKGPLSCGRAWGMAGADTGLAAVGTEGGGVLIFGGSSSGVTFQGSIPYKASRVELSADGTVLAAQFGATQQYWTDMSVRAFSLPSGTMIHEWTNLFDVTKQNFIFGLSLARGGTQLGQITSTFLFNTWTYTLSATDLSGATTSFTEQLSESVGYNAPGIFVSPDGTLVAVADQKTAATQVFKNGMLFDAVAGLAAGWIDDDRLIIGGTSIHSVSTSTTVATIAVPCSTKGFRAIDATHIYCPSTNAIYDLTTSAAVWTGSAPAFPIGTIAGAYAVYPLDHHVQVQAYSF